MNMRKSLIKEQVIDLQTTFQDLERKDMAGSFGTWFNFPIADEKLVEKAKAMLEDIEVWKTNWELVLSEAQKRIQAMKDAELLGAIDRMTPEERSNLINKLKNQIL